MLYRVLEQKGKKILGLPKRTESIHIVACNLNISFHFLASFIDWLYPSGGEGEVESSALGIIILWTTWQVSQTHTEVVLVMVAYAYGQGPCMDYIHDSYSLHLDTQTHSHLKCTGQYVNVSSVQVRFQC